MSLCAKFARLFALCLTGSDAGRDRQRPGAADYPTRPVRWIVPYPAGGATDITARIMGQWLSERLGQQFIIENKPGAGNNIGTEAVVNSPPDGYTVLLVNPANAINATLYQKLSFNFIRDMRPVAGFMRVPNVMEVNPSVPAKTVAEFIAYAKANPGKINWATSGNGTSVHLSGELFKMMTGVELTHVPYRGLGAGAHGHDQRSGASDVRQHAALAAAYPGGKLRALGGDDERSAPTRCPMCRPSAKPWPATRPAPSSAWRVPKGTPPEIIEKLNKEINAGARRSQDQGAPGGARRHADPRQPGGLRQTRRRAKPTNGPR